MQHLDVSGAVRHIHGSLGVKRLNVILKTVNKTIFTRKSNILASLNGYMFRLRSNNHHSNKNVCLES